MIQFITLIPGKASFNLFKNVKETFDSPFNVNEWETVCCHQVCANFKVLYIMSIVILAHTINLVKVTPE